MRIVNLEEFRKMPSGTIYRKYEPCSFGDICVKHDTWEYDFLYQDLIDFESDDSGDYVNMCEKMVSGDSVAISFDTVSRDGLFEKNQMFLILEKEDVKSLYNFIGDLLAE